MTDSSDSDLQDSEDEQRPLKRPKLIDDAAEESGDDNSDDDEEDDDNNNEYEKDGFVVDEAPDEGDDLQDSDDDDDEEENRLSRLRKMSKEDKLDEDDLLLVQEHQEKDERPKHVVGKSREELQKGLFDDDQDEEEAQERQVRVERYDEDGMDDFIEDDIGNQDEIMASERRQASGQEISEAQMQEASEIFGTDYMEFLQEADETAIKEEDDLLEEDGFEDDFSDEDDDLFDDMSPEQRKEALRTKREEREQAKAQRRDKAQKERLERRKAQLRRAFEPVQLMENFITEKDEQIRQTDVPERFFDWKVPFYGSTEEGMTDDEENQALWIVNRIPKIASVYQTAPPDSQKEILQSVTTSLRYMHVDKLEPAFIKRYRKDYVIEIVRENLYEIMDQDGEWDRLVVSREKVQEIIDVVNNAAEGDEAAGADVEYLQKLEGQLKDAQEQLQETAKQESNIKAELAVIENDDDDDDELFGDDDDKAEEKIKEKEKLSSHLSTIQQLLEARAEKVEQLQNQVKIAEERNRAMNDPGPMERIKKKTMRDSLWNRQDYLDFLSSIKETRNLADLNQYFNLLKEGNDAIRKKELPVLALTEKDEKKRSRRFDRDFYRTCVAEGLRYVCYRFLIAPNRAGIKLGEFVTTNQFNFTRAMPGDEGGGPSAWDSPTVEDQSPSEFASDLVNSGDLVVMSLDGADPAETKDLLRGCRYVAAMELASEPRIKMHLRNLYRKHAVLTTKPTTKGMEEIDAFHEYYGVHLIRNKPVSHHFPATNEEIQQTQADMMTDDERSSIVDILRKREEDSCVQYLKVLKAEQTGIVSVHLHLPLIEEHSDWYSPSNHDFAKRESQNVNILLSELERVYLPIQGDSEEWNAERKKILKDALFKYLLPQFEAELRKDLRVSSSKIGISLAAINLGKTAMEGSYRPVSMLYSVNRFLRPTGDLSLVGMCVGGDGKDASYLASVTEDGEHDDYLAIPPGARIDSDSSSGSGADGDTMSKAESMREKVIRFLVHNRPAAVLVGTSGGFQSRMTVRKMQDIIQEAMRRWTNRSIQGEDEDDDAFNQRRDSLVKGNYYHEDFDDEGYDWNCNVDLIDDSVSQLFGRSVRGSKEFPDFGTNLRIAISIARYAKDPLAELTYAWSVASDAGVFGTEMLFLNIHPLQRLLPKTQLLRAYERVLTDTTATVGCDINLSCKFDHLRGLLVFVPGFGPRKAAHLKQVMAQLGSSISRRRDLLEKRFVGPKVYNNSVAFLRIRGADGEDQHPLDDTRLHPDIYLRNNWAIKIAFDALEREDSKAGENATKKALRDVMENSKKEVERLYNATLKEWEDKMGKNTAFNVQGWDPRNLPVNAWRDKVEELDLEAFANMIEDSKLGRWHSHFEMIKWEFRLPFVEIRDPMEQLHGDRLFTLITGETDQSLRPGKEVVGKVVQNGEFGSRVKLEGDIPAFIPLRNMKDDEHVETAESVLSVGQIVHAVITELKKDHMTVDMSLKREDRYKLPSSWERPSSLVQFDEYFDKASAAQIERDNDKKRQAHLEALDLRDSQDPTKKRVGRVVRRACTHPAFRNARHPEVDKELKEGGSAMVGEALIRPSSKNSDSLALHWVVKEGAIRVVEIEEDDKETDASIGNKLKIKGETYGSIDELLGRYVAPMNDYVEELVNYRKFVDLDEDELDERLIKEKEESPSSIPYAICWSEANPGYATLRFVTTSLKARSHYIAIEPYGFRWGHLKFSSLEKLVNAFKQDPRGEKIRQAAADKAAEEKVAAAVAAAAAAAVAAVRASAPPPANPPPRVTPLAGNNWGSAVAPPLPVPAVGAGASWGAPVNPGPPPPPRPGPPGGGWGAPVNPSRPPPPRPPMQSMPGGPWGAPVNPVPPPARPAAPGGGAWGVPTNPVNRPPPPPVAPGAWGEPVGGPPRVPPPPHQQAPPLQQDPASMGRGKSRTLPAWLSKGT